MLDNSINSHQENPRLPPSSSLLRTVCKVAVCQVAHVPTGSGEAWLSHQSLQALPHPLLTSLHPIPKCSALVGSLPKLSRHTQHCLSGVFFCPLFPSRPLPGAHPSRSWLHPSSCDSSLQLHRNSGDSDATFQPLYLSVTLSTSSQTLKEASMYF